MALKFGNLILIATTSCFAIIITAILTPIMLKEKFTWKIDGVSIGLITAGCSIAIYQQPEDVSVDKLTADNVTNAAIEHITSLRFFMFLVTMFVIYLTRTRLYAIMFDRFDEFYENIKDNYFKLRNIVAVDSITDEGTHPAPQL
jgi:hypothetical protein